MSIGDSGMGVEQKFGNPELIYKNVSGFVAETIESFQNEKGVCVLPDLLDVMPMVVGSHPDRKYGLRVHSAGMTSSEIATDMRRNVGKRLPEPTQIALLDAVGEVVYGVTDDKGVEYNTWEEKRRQTMKDMAMEWAEGHGFRVGGSVLASPNLLLNLHEDKVSNSSVKEDMNLTEFITSMGVEMSLMSYNVKRGVEAGLYGLTHPIEVISETLQFMARHPRLVFTQAAMILIFARCRGGYVTPTAEPMDPDKTLVAPPPTLESKPTRPPTASATVEPVSTYAAPGELSTESFPSRITGLEVIDPASAEDQQSKAASVVEQVKSTMSEEAREHSQFFEVKGRTTSGRELRGGMFGIYEENGAYWIMLAAKDGNPFTPDYFGKGNGPLQPYALVSQRMANGGMRLFAALPSGLTPIFDVNDGGEIEVFYSLYGDVVDSNGSGMRMLAMINPVDDETFELMKNGGKMISLDRKDGTSVVLPAFLVEKNDPDGKKHAVEKIIDFALSSGKVKFNWYLPPNTAPKTRLRLDEKYDPKAAGPDFEWRSRDFEVSGVFIHLGVVDLVGGCYVAFPIDDGGFDYLYIYSDMEGAEMVSIMQEVGFLVSE